jgi:hypothetical protein
VASYDAGLQVIDILDPTDPQLAGYYQTGDLAFGVYADSDNIYVADRGDGFYILRYGDVGVLDWENGEKPPRVFLERCYPNPSSGCTTICFEVSEPGSVDVSIFDSMGQLVETLEKGHRGIGTYKAIWDANVISQGVYYVVVKTCAGRVGTERLVVVR